MCVLQKENARAPEGEQWAAWDIWSDQLWYDLGGGGQGQGPVVAGINLSVKAIQRGINGHQFR